MKSRTIEMTLTPGTTGGEGEVVGIIIVGITVVGITVVGFTVWGKMTFFNLLRHK